MHGDKPEFELRRHEDVSVLSVSGELDMASVDEFKRLRAQALEAELPLAIDLTDCGFVDSLGLAGITMAYLAVTEAGQRFALAGSGSQVKQVIELTGMADAIPYFSDLAAAVEYLRRNEP
jgi:anti-anti-sigma factor